MNIHPGKKKKKKKKKKRKDKKRATMKVLLFGPFGGMSSYPVVMRGLRKAFTDLGLDVISADITGYDGDLDPRDARSLGNGVVPDGLDFDLVFAMKPSLTMGRLVDQGHKLVGLHVGDVSIIPNEWKLIMAKESLVVVPSTWMELVTKISGVETEVFVAPHGVEEAYIRASQAEKPDDPFKWVHFCSADTYPERKGTPQALRAFQKALIDRPNQTLTLIVPEVRRRLKRVLGELNYTARMKVNLSTKPMGVTPQTMVGIYQSHHALLAPSRAEGYGLQPQEARAVGVPVVQTFCTGFADGPGLDDPSNCGVVQVQHGDLEEAWGDFGEAPSVPDESIMSAMFDMMDNYDSMYESVGNTDASNWSWTERSRGLVERLKEL